MKTPSNHSYHILIENGRKALVSDCKRIAEYSSERIVLQLSSHLVTLSGSDLTLSDFFGSEIQICGKIESVNLKGENSEKQKNTQLQSY